MIGPRRPLSMQLERDVARLVFRRSVMSRVAFVTPEPLDSEVPPPERSWATTIVIPLLLMAALWWAQSVAIPIVVSLLISYALEPTITRLEQSRVPRFIGAPL